MQSWAKVIVQLDMRVFVGGRMKGRKWRTLSLNALLVLIGVLLGVAESFAASQHNSLLSRALQRDSLPILGLLIVILVAIQVIIFHLDNPSAPSRRWDPNRTPYLGLESFAEEDAAIFFGRDGKIDEMMLRLHGRQEDRFVALTGGSGSGKSSLVQAGLVPRLRARRWLVLPVMTPGIDPIGSLASVFSESGEYVTELRTKPHALIPLISQLRHRQGRRFSRVLLVVDQLEELFTLSSQRDAFLGLLEEAVKADPRFWVVAVVRMEFLVEFLHSPHAQLFGRPVALGAMASADLETVIEQPAALVGMRFAPGLVSRIVADTGTSDALPLLGYLLQELYFEVGRRGTATSEDYEGLGGVTGALSRQADAVVAELSAEAGVESILNVLIRFVTTDGTQATRRRVDLAGFTETERRIVDAFVNARLLVTDVTNDSAVAQVAHEALFRNWPLLREEVQARTEQLRQRAELERWTADWQHSNRKSSYLLTGERLELAVQWVASLGDQAPDIVREFIEQSRRQNLAGLRTVSESIGEYVLANVERLPDLAVMLALAALSEYPPTPVARRALLAALAFNHLTRVLEGHTDEVWRLAWSPNGQYVATASVDGTARIWDVASGECIAVLKGHPSTVETIAWSPDSAYLATTSRDRHIRLWNTAGKLVARLSRPSNVIRALAWSPDGRTIASGSDELLRIWDAHSHNLIDEFTGHADNIFGLAYSPDGRRVVTGSHDRTLRIWDMASGESLVIAGHQNTVESVDWSPDGTRVASASSDQSVRIWDAASGEQLLHIRRHTDTVWNVAWSPDGAWLATCGADRTARIWDPNNAEEVVTLHGHAGHVFDVTWSPEGARLATASADRTARIWQASARGGEAVSLIGHAGRIRDVVPAPVNAPQRRALIATCGDDRSIKIWEAAGDQVHALNGHTDSVLNIAWGETLLSCSSDRTIREWREPSNDAHASFIIRCENIPEAISINTNGRFASGEREGVIRVWDTADGSPIAEMPGHQEQITAIAWSPSGRLLASASDDRTARIWDMSTFREIAVLGAQGSVEDGHGSWVDSVSWSPDEQFVVTGSADHIIRIWTATGGRPIALLRGHQDRVHSVAWSSDGALIATGSYDTTVRVWDARTHAEIGVVGVHRDKVTSVAWSADSKQVLSGSFDGTARIWNADVDWADLEARARTRIFRSLTASERRAHLLPVLDG
jgi:WD40 repeat protein